MHGKEACFLSCLQTQSLSQRCEYGNKTDYRLHVRGLVLPRCNPLPIGSFPHHPLSRK
nr:MAG TPA: hypothetical protein [Caudoviricetes sp.]